MAVNNVIPPYILKRIQDCISKVPVLVIGSGASAAYGMAGMAQLAEHIIENIVPIQEEESVWKQFKQYLIDGVDLESALHKAQLSERLENEIVQETKKLILPKDIEIRENVVLNRIEMPLSKLLLHLYNTAFPQMKIVTTNYDRLVEYALDHAGIDYSFGFRGGYIQRFDGRFNHDKYSNKVEVLKVHGSLDWYADSMSDVIALPDSFQQTKCLAPVMVTPGKNKYQHTHRDPFRSIISRVDSVFSFARSLLIVGFGFNDEHIQPKLMQKMRHSQTPIVIISRTLTPRAREFIKGNEQSNILGIEKSGEGSNVVFPNKEDLEIEQSIWELEALLKIVT